MLWLGLILSTVGGLWLVVNAFRSHGVLWGLGSLIVPLVAQLYGLLNFRDNKIPLLLSVIGCVLVFMGWDDYTAMMQTAAGVAEPAP